MSEYHQTSDHTNSPVNNPPSSSPSSYVFKTNIHRQKTKRWVEAPKVDYGSGWGPDGDDDDDNSNGDMRSLSESSNVSHSRADDTTAAVTLNKQRFFVEDTRGFAEQGLEKASPMEQTHVQENLLATAARRGSADATSQPSPTMSVPTASPKFIRPSDIYKRHQEAEQRHELSHQNGPAKEHSSAHKLIAVEATRSGEESPSTSIGALPSTAALPQSFPPESLSFSPAQDFTSATSSTRSHSMAMSEQDAATNLSELHVSPVGPVSGAAINKVSDMSGDVRGSGSSDISGGDVAKSGADPAPADRPQPHPTILSPEHCTYSTDLGCGQWLRHPLVQTQTSASADIVFLRGCGNDKTPTGETRRSHELLEGSTDSLTPASSVDEELFEMLSARRRFLERQGTVYSIASRDEKANTQAQLSPIVENNDSSLPVTIRLESNPLQFVPQTKPLGPESEGIEAITGPIIEKKAQVIEDQSKPSENDYSKEFISLFSRPQTLMLKETMHMPPGTQILPPMPPMLGKPNDEVMPEVVDFDQDDEETAGVQKPDLSMHGAGSSLDFPPIPHPQSPHINLSMEQDSIFQEIGAISALTDPTERTRAYNALRIHLQQSGDLLSEWITYQMKHQNGEELLHTDMIAVKPHLSSKSRARVGLGNFFGKHPMDEVSGGDRVEERLERIGRGAVKLGEKAGGRFGGWIKGASKKGHRSKESLSNSTEGNRIEDIESTTSLAESYAPSESTSVASNIAFQEYENGVTAATSNPSPHPSFEQRLEGQQYSLSAAPQLQHTPTAYKKFPTGLQLSPSRSQLNRFQLIQGREHIPNQQFGTALSQAFTSNVHPLPVSKVPAQPAQFPARSDSLYADQALPEIRQGLFQEGNESLRHARENQNPATPFNVSDPLREEVESDDELYIFPPKGGTGISIQKWKPESAPESLQPHRDHTGATQQRKQSGLSAIRPFPSPPDSLRPQQTNWNQEGPQNPGGISQMLGPQGNFSTMNHYYQAQESQVLSLQHSQIYQKSHSQTPGSPKTLGFGLAEPPSGLNYIPGAAQQPGPSTSNKKGMVKRASSLGGGLEWMQRTVNQRPTNPTAHEPPKTVKGAGFLARLGTKQKGSGDSKVKTHKKGFSELFLRSSSTSSATNSPVLKKLSRLAKAGLAGGGSGGAQALVQSGEPKPQTGQYTSYDLEPSHRRGPGLHAPPQQIPTWVPSHASPSYQPSNTRQQPAGLLSQISAIEQSTPQNTMLTPNPLQQSEQPNLNGYCAQIFTQNNVATENTPSFQTSCPPSPFHPSLNPYPTRSGPYFAALPQNNQDESSLCNLKSVNQQRLSGKEVTPSSLGQDQVAPPSCPQFSSVSPFMPPNGHTMILPLPTTSSDPQHPIKLQQPVQPAQPPISSAPLRRHSTQNNDRSNLRSSMQLPEKLETVLAGPPDFHIRLPEKQEWRGGSSSTTQPSACCGESEPMSVESLAPRQTHPPNTLLTTSSEVNPYKTDASDEPGREALLLTADKGRSSPPPDTSGGDEKHKSTTNIDPSSVSLSQSERNDSSTPTAPCSATNASTGQPLDGSVAVVLLRGDEEVKLNGIEEKIAVRYEDDGEKEVVTSSACSMTQGNETAEKLEEDDFAMSSTAYPIQWEPAYYGWS